MDERRVALVTGCSRGIGRFLVTHLRTRGYAVCGCSRSPVDDPSLDAHFIADVSDEAKVKEMFTGIRKRFGRLDAVVNNAGMAAMNHVLLTPAASARALLDVNTLGTFLVSREAAKMMQARRVGRIVNLSTVAVPFALAGEAMYAASKAAVETLTRVMAHEVGPLGVTVNAVGPTPVDTDLIRGIPREKLDGLVKRQAIQRMGTFEDVANVVDFFLDEKSAFVTGQVVYLGGA